MNKRTLFVLLGATVLCSCGSKKTDNENTVVKVKTSLVQEASGETGLSYPGTIEEMSGSDISFATAGTIKSLSIHDGQAVSAGQTLGVLDPTTTDNAIVMAASATQQARETLNQAEDAYTRMKSLHDKGSLPDIQWVEIQTKVSNARLMLKQAQASEQIARKGKTDTRLVAPFSGYISHKNAEVGQNVMPGVSVARVVKIDQVKVVLSIPEDEINNIKVGQQVRFSVASLGNESFSGTIQEKGVSADAISRCYKVKAVVSNGSHCLLPGMVCDASIIENTGTQQISLPANIIQIDIDNKPFVWTVSNGKAHKKFITLGDNIGNRVLIIDGLTVNDKVIISGQQKVYEGGAVKEN